MKVQKAYIKRERERVYKNQQKPKRAKKQREKQKRIS